MITYQIEPWSTIRTDIESLIDAHWREVAMYQDEIPLQVMWDTYDAMEKQGLMHCMAVRELGELVGYYIGMVKPHLHYANSLTFFTDVYFLSQKHRKGRAGLKLFTEMKKSLKKRGVQRMIVSTKVRLDMSKVLYRLGFHEAERVFTTLI